MSANLGRRQFNQVQFLVLKDRLLLVGRPRNFADGIILNLAIATSLEFVERHAESL